MLYMVTWIPSIYPSHVSIYTSTMDPMGYTFDIGVIIYHMDPYGALLYIISIYNLHYNIPYGIIISSLFYIYHMVVETLLGHPVAPRGTGDGGYVLLPMEWQLSPGQARKQTVAATRVAGSDLRSKRSSVR